MSPQRLFHSDLVIEVTIACCVFILVTGTMLFAVVYRRRGAGRPPSGKSAYYPVELTYVAVVAGIAIFLIVTSLTTNGDRLATRPAVTVRATGFQWCWRFQYEGTSVVRTAQCLSQADIPTIVLPAGKVIRFDVTSVDVLHAFWIPHLKFKTMAYPDHVNSFEATFSHPGVYPGRCAEFCGLYHDLMHFTVRVVPSGAFTSWLHGQERTAGAAP